MSQLMRCDMGLEPEMLRNHPNTVIERPGQEGTIGPSPRKEKGRPRPSVRIVSSQLREHHGTQGHIAIFGALGVANGEAHAGAIDVCGEQSASLRDPKAATVDDTKQRAMFYIPDGPPQALNLASFEHP